MNSRLFAALMLLFASTGFAGAQTVAETLTEWSLMGLWSADCDRFPSERNTYLRFTAGPDGRALLERDSGETRISGEVTAAEIAADRSLTLRVRFPREKAAREISYVKALPRVMRVIIDRAIGGDFTIREGKYLATGEATLWQMRCY